MASAHLHASIGSRGKGHSAVGASAYRARAELVDERTGEQHDYTRHRSKCLWSGIYAPKDAPDWTRDSARLWNHVEAFEKHKKAELYREVEISLPHELTLEQNRYLLQDWIKENVTRRGLICEAFIHEAPKGGDERNIHAHVMIVTRKLDGTEFQRSKDKFDSYAAKQEHWAEALRAERASWEKHANRFLERYGHEARIDMGRRDGAEPTVHLGKHATALERLGIKTELGDINRAVEALNERQRAANENEAAPRIAEWLEDRAAEQLETLSRLAADEILEPEAGHQVADLDAALRARIRALEAQDPERFREIMGAYAPAHFAEWLQEREGEARARQPETPATILGEPPREATQRASYEVDTHGREAERAENVIHLPYEPDAAQWQHKAAAPAAAPTPEAARPAPEPEAAHPPENRHREAEPARPSYLPETVIHLPYDPAPGLAAHIMRPAREAEATARAERETRQQETIAGIEARIAEAERRQAEKTPEELAAEREAYRQGQEATKLGPVAERPEDFRSVWDEVRDHTREQSDDMPTGSRGMVEPVREGELPVIRSRPGMIFIGKCLEWGIAMAGRIVDAIASIFESQPQRQREKPHQLTPPAPEPVQQPAQRRSLAAEMLHEAQQAREADKLTEKQREGADRLREGLRDQDSRRERDYRR